jgi:Tfp pilus assembly protein FimV
LLAASSLNSPNANHVERQRRFDAYAEMNPLQMGTRRGSGSSLMRGGRRSLDAIAQETQKEEMEGERAEQKAAYL